MANSNDVRRAAGQPRHPADAFIDEVDRRRMAMLDVCGKWLVLPDADRRAFLLPVLDDVCDLSTIYPFIEAVMELINRVNYAAALDPFEEVRAAFVELVDATVSWTSGDCHSEEWSKRWDLLCIAQIMFKYARDDLCDHGSNHAKSNKFVASDYEFLVQFINDPVEKQFASRMADELRQGHKPTKTIICREIAERNGVREKTLYSCFNRTIRTIMATAGFHSALLRSRANSEALS